MVFIARANIFRQTASKDIVFYDELPPRTFSVNADMEGFYLQEAEDMKRPPRVYGDVDVRAKRILNTFHQRPRGTGILLTGEKGSGKTMLARVISQIARDEHKMPTIIVNNPFAGEGFNNFMASLGPAVVIFDEFEKVYSDHDVQAALLTLLDGTHSTHKLCIMTCNNEYKLVEQMSNRPGRFFYRMRYTGLDQDFVREYCEENLRNQEHTQSVVSYATLFHEFNFDMLSAIVEDMNRYDEPLSETVKFINASPENASNTYKVRRFEPAKPEEWKEARIDYDEKSGISVNPMKPFTLGFYFKSEDDDHDYSHFTFGQKDIVKVDMNGTFYYETPECKLVLERFYPARFNLADMMF